MRLAMPFTEILDLALQGAPLPPPVGLLACEGTTVRVDLDLHAIPAPPLTIRALAALAPIVHVEATFRAFDTGVAEFDLAVRAGAVPVQRLLKHLTGLLNAGLRSAHLPEGLVVIERGSHGAPLAVVDLQAAIATQADGVALTGFAIADGAVEVVAVVHGFALHQH